MANECTITYFWRHCDFTQNQTNQLAEIDETKPIILLKNNLNSKCICAINFLFRNFYKKFNFPTYSLFRKPVSRSPFSDHRALRLNAV